MNQNGFSANAIDCKWSVIKRWIQKRISGRLPAHADRQKWSLLIDEHQARSMLKPLGSHSLDKGQTQVIRFHDVMKLLRVA